MPNSSAYNPVTPDLVQALIDVVGKGSVFTDEEKLETYSHDETDAAIYGHSPEVVVMPGTTEQVAQVVKLANKARVPITTRGAGSGLSGGAIP